MIAPEPYANPAGKPYVTGMYRDIRRIVKNNLIYLGNIRALQHWYRDVRVHFMAKDPYHAACHEGAMFKLSAVFKERMHRLDQFVGKLPRSMELLREGGGKAMDSFYLLQESLVQEWPSLKEHLNQDDLSGCERKNRDRLLEVLVRIQTDGSSWVDRIQSLDSQAKQAGTSWLQSIADGILGLWQGTK